MRKHGSTESPIAYFCHHKKYSMLSCRDNQKKKEYGKDKNTFTGNAGQVARFRQK